jgi:hypothetical protein
MLPEDKLEMVRHCTIVDGRPLQVVVNGSKETPEICIVFSGKPMVVSLTALFCLATSVIYNVVV